MNARPHDDDRATRANDLYWDSEASVNDIAERLDLSKGTLYGMIRPRAVGLSCPECGDELEYANRTARDKGYVTCPSCGLEEEEELVRELSGDARTSSTEPDGVAASTSAVLATAFLGTAAGVLMIRWLRGR